MEKQVAIHRIEYQRAEHTVKGKMKMAINTDQPLIIEDYLAKLPNVSSSQEAKLER